MNDCGLETAREKKKKSNQKTTTDIVDVEWVVVPESDLIKVNWCY